MSTETRPRRARSGDGLFILALVGRAGSGKSTVARALVADGAALIEADALGHEITDGDPEVRAALVSEYGPEVYGPEGRLDRARVASRVFGDPVARDRLNRLVHPRLIRRIRERIEALREGGHRGMVVVDAALMLDWGLERDCDAVLAVVAPHALQRERLQAGRGWSAEEAEARLAAQRSNDEFAGAADATLSNEGSREALEREARRVVQELRAMRPRTEDSKRC